MQTMIIGEKRERALSGEIQANAVERRRHNNQRAHDLLAGEPKLKTLVALAKNNSRPNRSGFSVAAPMGQTGQIATGTFSSSSPIRPLIMILIPLRPGLLGEAPG